MTLTLEQNEFIWAEMDRVNNAVSFQAPQSIAVQRDMKEWAEKSGMWPAAHYQDIVLGHAEARGWTQKGFTGMEIWG
jgi:poly(3-hydroxyalkanoate) synthetase